MHFKVAWLYFVLPQVSFAVTRRTAFHDVGATNRTAIAVQTPSPTVAASLFFAVAAASFDAGVDACSQSGGHICSILNSAEASAAKAVCEQLGQNECWIGLQWEQGAWAWHDGSAFDVSASPSGGDHLQNGDAEPCVSFRMSSNIWHDVPCSNYGAHAICRQSTPNPTPSPTQSPTPSPVQGTGDPHLVNMYGERFDIYQSGAHVLLQVPRGAALDATRLLVKAHVEQFGAACGEMYFRAFNVTGSWVESNSTVDHAEIERSAYSRTGGGLQFLAGSAGGRRSTEWMYFGGVGLKVVWGHTWQGIEYLNVHLKHLGQVGLPVGGLLGADDHEQASTKSHRCIRTIALKKGYAASPSDGSPTSSTDALTFAAW